MSWIPKVSAPTALEALSVILVCVGSAIALWMVARLTSIEWAGLGVGLLLAVAGVIAAENSDRRRPRPGEGRSLTRDRGATQ